MNFWDAHGSVWGLILLFGFAVFPRITTFFAAGPFGCLAWLGWIFAPHLLVAILATYMYWHTNPILCVIAWFFAFGGTAGEGAAANKGRKKFKK